jgi:hypothetical protein
MYGAAVRCKRLSSIYRYCGLATAAYIAEPSRVAGHVVAVNEAEIELVSGRNFSPASGAK